ncbi:MAG: HIT family protein [Candidatus Omnitrophota bacterium]
MASIFSKIVNGEIPAQKIAEDERFLAFLSIQPLRIGHTLVIPKKEVDYLFDLDDRLLSDLMLFSKKIAIAIKKAYPCRKVAVLVYGLEVAHAHVHLVPVDGTPGEIHFANARPVKGEDLLKSAEKIRACL